MRGKRWKPSGMRRQLFDSEEKRTWHFCVNTITNPQTLKGKSLLMDIIPYLLSLIQFHRLCRGSGLSNHCFCKGMVSGHHRVGRSSFYDKPHIFKDYTTFSKEKAMTSLFCVNTITNPQTLKGKSLLMDQKGPRSFLIHILTWRLPYRKSIQEKYNDET